MQVRVSAYRRIDASAVGDDAQTGDGATRVERRNAWRSAASRCRRPLFLVPRVSRRRCLKWRLTFAQSEYGRVCCCWGYSRGPSGRKSCSGRYRKCSERGWPRVCGREDAAIVVPPRAAEPQPPTSDTATGTPRGMAGARHGLRQRRRCRFRGGTGVSPPNETTCPWRTSLYTCYQNDPHAACVDTNTSTPFCSATRGRVFRDQPPSRSPSH